MAGAKTGSGRRPEWLETYHRQIADALIEQLERGAAPWTKPWKPGELVLPYNLSTGESYRGGNSIVLTALAARRGYADERWATYKQIQEAGGQVRKGERGVRLIHVRTAVKRVRRDENGKPLRDREGNPLYETRPLQRPQSRSFVVFNAEQADRLPQRPLPAPATWQRHEEAERAIRQTEAKIQYTSENRAYYELRNDRIVLPFEDRFKDAAAYYQTALHELGHWTGHPTRLNRETLIAGSQAGFESPEYAREELRAEIGSLMSGQRLGIGHNPERHAAYVGDWIRALKKDPTEIYRAARDAQRMSDYLLERGRERQPAAVERGQQAASLARPTRAPQAEFEIAR